MAWIGVSWLSPQAPNGSGGGGHELPAPGVISRSRKSALFWSVSVPSAQRERPSSAESAPAPVPSV
jgi:hypothetical protein